MAIHPSAIVSHEAKIDEGDVDIGPFTIIHPNVEICGGTKIGSHCEIGVPTVLSDGSPLRIGANSTIRSHSVFYEGSTFGEGLITGHRVSIREKTRAGKGFQLGTLGDMQGHCKIGDFVKLHSNVFVAQYSTIEDFVWIFPRVTLTNDPHPPSEVVLGATIRRHAAVAAMSTILPGVTIGEGALVGACSVVTKDVGNHRIVMGSPAKDRGPTSIVKLRDGSGRPAYPWTAHYHRGYPEEVISSWVASISDVL